MLCDYDVDSVFSSPLVVSLSLSFFFSALGFLLGVYCEQQEE